MKKILLLALLLSFSLCAQAKDIRIVIPYAAGGANDRIARIIEKELSNKDYTFVVEFKPGANGAIGAAYVANVKNESTLMIASNGFVIAPLLNTSAGYNPFTDFIVVKYIGTDLLVLVVKNTGQIKNFGDFIKMSINTDMPYGSVGVGSISHLTGATVSRDNTNFIHVPYKGMSAVLPDLLNGNIKWTIDAPQNVDPFILSNDLIPIAVYGPHRILEYPNIPTVRELGINDQGLSRWYAVVANREADPQLISYLKNQLSNKSIQNKFKLLGINTGNTTHDNFIQSETDKIKQILQYIKI